MNMPTPKKRTLLICQDIVGRRMAGPGIRYVRLAETLASHVDITLAVPEQSDVTALSPEIDIVRFRFADWPSIAAHAHAADSIVLPSDVATGFPQLAGVRAALVIDGYDPLLAEWLSLGDREPSDRLQSRVSDRLADLRVQYTLGDFYICASERQRDWWLGLLESHGRINAYTFRDDRSLRRLIDVVMTGLPAQPPVHTRTVLRGVVPGINTGDKVILWGGGLWSWLDPQSAIHAVARIAGAHPDIKLYFPGTRRPNPFGFEIPDLAREAMALADKLGVTGRSVVFGDWVDFEDWPNVLLESDVSLSLHHDTLETRLAFRNRLLDSVWAGLPIVSTRGDATSEIVDTYQLGETVNFGDAQSIGDAIIRQLNRPRHELTRSLERARAMLSWDEVTKPLIRFCLDPRKAADRAHGMVQPAMSSAEMAAARDTLASHEARWAQLESSPGWRVLKSLQRLRARVTPPDSDRERLLLLGLRGLSRIKSDGPGPVLREAVRVLRAGRGGLRSSARNVDNARLYESWRNTYEPDAAALDRQRAWVATLSKQPLISVVTPVFNPPLDALDGMIDSVLAQTYGQWELCLADASTDPQIQARLAAYVARDSRIRLRTLDSNLGISGNSNVALAMATGEYIALLDHDDVLTPNALFEVASALNGDGADADLIYSDHDVISADGRVRSHPLFKPGWSPETMLSACYITHLTVFSRQALLRAGGGFDPAMDGAQDWDLFLRIIETASRVAHIPKILYHWRNSAGSTALNTSAKPYALEAQRRALNAHLGRTHRAHGTVTFEASGFLRAKWPHAQPSVSILIPARGASERLIRCVDSILKQTQYPAFDITIVNNGPLLPAAFPAYAKLTASGPVRVLHSEAPFNYAAINNWAAKQTHGELLLLLNDDTEAIHADWLDEMAMWAQLPQIGAVGAKLLHPSGVIQHVGVAIGLTGFAGHPFAGAAENIGTIAGFTEWYRNWHAVTGACLMTRRAVWEQLGGMDEQFTLNGNDVDYGLRLHEQGYRVMTTPFARLRHLESATVRSLAQIPPGDFAVSFERYAPILEAGDRYYNPNLSRWSLIPRVRAAGEAEPLTFARDHLHKLQTGPKA
jgi:GT2 family glycosyltransferase/glycosyltransferase involved in cell wall biosynthesis